MRKILYENKSDSIWIKIDVYESKEGMLIVSGYESGRIVKKIKHKSDYEYYLTIEKESIKLLIKKLGLKNKEALFNWFEKEYSTDKAVSQIMEKLKELQIKYQFSVW